jgi:hypothetical protein
MGRVIEPPTEREEEPYELQFFAHPHLVHREQRAVIQLLVVDEIPRARVEPALPDLFDGWSGWGFRGTDFPLTAQELLQFQNWYGL